MMAEFTIEVERPAQTPGGQQKAIDRLEALREVRPAAPPAASPSPAPSPASSAPTRGPHNNWLQRPAYKTIAGKPQNYDPGKAPTDDAPHGFLQNGDPFSPYGCTERGRIRRLPVPSREGRDPCAQAAAGDAGARRLAASDLKPAADVVGLHARIDEDYKRICDDVRELRQRHPETKYSIPPHPKEIGAGDGEKLGEPFIVEEMISDGLTGATGVISKWLKDPDAKPAKKSIEVASKRIAIASRYYGLDTDPKTTATVAAVVALLFVFAPAILCAIGKLIDKIRGDK
jgi:hypothetical protein